MQSKFSLWAPLGWGVVTCKRLRDVCFCFSWFAALVTGYVASGRLFRGKKASFGKEAGCSETEGAF